MDGWVGGSVMRAAERGFVPARGDEGGVLEGKGRWRREDGHHERVWREMGEAQSDVWWVPRRPSLDPEREGARGGAGR